MALTLTISGTSRLNILVNGSSQITRTVRGRSTASFQLFDKAQAYRPLVGAPVVLSDGSTTFTGTVDTVDESRHGGVLDVVRFSVTCQDYAAIFDHRVVNARYAAGVTVAAVVAAINTTFLSGEGFDLTNVSGTAVLSDPLEFDFRTVTECLNQLADLAGSQWWCIGKSLWMKNSVGAPPAPFAITDSSLNWAELTVKYSRSASYRNVQYVRADVSIGNNGAISVQDNTKIAARAAVEGGSGRWEAVEVLKDLDSEAVATDMANQILAKSGDLPVSIQYRTDSGGLECGLSQTVTLSANGINATYYVVGISSQEIPVVLKNGLWYRHTVTLSSVQDQGNWLRLFENLWNRGKSGRVAAGLGGTLGATVTMPLALAAGDWTLTNGPYDNDPQTGAARAWLIATVTNPSPNATYYTAYYYLGTTPPTDWSQWKVAAFTPKSPSGPVIIEWVVDGQPTGPTYWQVAVVPCTDTFRNTPTPGVAIKQISTAAQVTGINLGRGQAGSIGRGVGLSGGTLGLISIDTTNMLVNGDFEYQKQGWSDSAAGWGLDSTAANVHSGSLSIVSATSTAALAQSGGVCVENSIYVVEGWYRSAFGAAGAPQFLIWWLDSAGSVISTHGVLAFGGPTSAAWLLASGQLISPVGAVGFIFLVYMAGATGTWWVDSVRMSRAPNAAQLTNLSTDLAVVSGNLAIQNIDLGKSLGTSYNGAEFRISAGKMTVNGVDMGKVIAGTVTTELGIDGSTGKFGVAALAATKITAGTLAAGVIYAGALNATQVLTGTLGAGVIYAGAILVSQLTAGTATFTGDVTFQRSGGASIVINSSAVVLHAGSVSATLDSTGLACDTVNCFQLSASSTCFAGQFTAVVASTQYPGVSGSFVAGTTAITVTKGLITAITPGGG